MDLGLGVGICPGTVGLGFVFGGVWVRWLKVLFVWFAFSWVARLALNVWFVVV